MIDQEAFRRTDRTDAPLSLSRYAARRTAEAKVAAAPEVDAADDPATPLYLRRFRNRATTGATPVRSTPLEGRRRAVHTRLRRGHPQP